MNRRSYILATAGHVDHGKSALIKALTGSDPDRLPEEKARGITIDLGFAYLELPADEQNEFSLGIVDVPGHEDFVKNMVAGVGSIDVALLVIAADDGWMPQTEEHLQILGYLDVTKGVVALTKSDLSEDLESAIAGIREKLANSSLADAPIIPTSVVANTGIDELRTALADVIRTTPLPADVSKPRLSVDRAFSLKGLGTVVTGTLSGGSLVNGQSVVIQPGNRRSRVRSIQSHGADQKMVNPGVRTALNLADVSVGDGPNGAKRGDTICDSGLGMTSQTWDVRISKSVRLKSLKLPAAQPLKHEVRVQVHHGSGCVAAKVMLLEGGSVNAGETAFAQIRFEEPVFGFAGDCFVVRDWSEQWTLAGGVVLDPAAERKQLRSEQRLARLQKLSSAEGAIERLRAELDYTPVLDVDLIKKSTLFRKPEIDSAVKELVDDGCIASGHRLIDGNYWVSTIDGAAKVIDAFHQKFPEKPGLPLVDLKTELTGLIDELFGPLTQALSERGFVQKETLILRRTHQLELPPALQAAGERVKKALAQNPMEPPSRKELAPNQVSQSALKFLVDSGQAVILSNELAMAADAYEEAVQMVTEHIHKNGPARVSDLRPVLGTTRRILIPFLEHLDKQRITVRDGDVRRLNH
jgi:selenocysteine-specific elongation factor